MTNKLKVLSLFDGISGCRQALKEMNIDCDYYASEIDKWAIQVAQDNHPGIKQNCFNRMCYQLGDYAHISKRDKLLYLVLVRAKENIQKLKCIIVYENLKEDIDKYYETSIPYENKTQPYNNVLNDEDYEFIKKWNELDIELYNFVMDNLGSKYSQFKL